MLEVIKARPTIHLHGRYFESLAINSDYDGQASLESNYQFIYFKSN